MPVYEVYDERLGKDYCSLIIADNPRDAAIRYHNNSPDNAITVVVVEVDEHASAGFVESESKWRVTREVSTSITHEAEPVSPKPEPEPSPSPDSPPVGIEPKPEPKFKLGQRVALASDPDVDMCVEWNDWHENLAGYSYVCVWLDIDQKPAREHYSEHSLISKEPKPLEPDGDSPEEQYLQEEVSKDLDRVYEVSLAKRFTIFAESYLRELERRLSKCNNIPGVVCGEIRNEAHRNLQGIENKLFDILEMPESEEKWRLRLQVWRNPERVVNGTLDNGDYDPDDPGFEDSEVDPC